MEEITVDDKWLGQGKIVEQEPWVAPNEETQLVIVGLLMRLYDVQMAILSAIDKEMADKIYDAHSEGGHFNPPIYVPEPVR